MNAEQEITQLKERTEHFQTALTRLGEKYDDLSKTSMAHAGEVSSALSRIQEQLSVSNNRMEKQEDFTASFSEFKSDFRHMDSNVQAILSQLSNYASKEDLRLLKETQKEICDKLEKIYPKIEVDKEIKTAFEKADLSDFKIGARYMLGAGAIVLSLFFSGYKIWNRPDELMNAQTKAQNQHVIEYNNLKNDVVSHDTAITVLTGDTAKKFLTVTKQITQLNSAIGTNANGITSVEQTTLKTKEHIERMEKKVSTLSKTGKEQSLKIEERLGTVESFTKQNAGTLRRLRKSRSKR